jgi:uncharacterized protein (DUF697 family)
VAVEGTIPTTALVFAAGLFPVPFVDTLLQNAVRRRFVTHVSARYGLELAAPEVADLADAPLAPGRRMFFYVVKKVLGRLLYPLAVAGAVAQVRSTWTLGDRVLSAGALPMPEPG